MPDVYVKGHLVQKLLLTHTHTHTALPGPLNWSVTVEHKKKIYSLYKDSE